MWSNISNLHSRSVLDHSNVLECLCYSRSLIFNDSKDKWTSENWNQNIKINIFKVCVPSFYPSPLYEQLQNSSQWVLKKGRVGENSERCSNENSSWNIQVCQRNFCLTTMSMEWRLKYCMNGWANCVNETQWQCKMQNQYRYVYFLFDVDSSYV